MARVRQTAELRLVLLSPPLPPSPTILDDGDMFKRMMHVEQSTTPCTDDIVMEVGNAEV